MENNVSNEFNKVTYLRNYIAKFLQSQNKAKHEIVGNLRLLNNNSNGLYDKEKKQILERLDKLFSAPNFVALIQKEKQKNGIVELSTVIGDERIENLHKIAVLSQKLTDSLSEIVFSDLKRTYNMAKLTSNKMISNIKTSDGSTRKAINYFEDPKPAQIITDFSGSTISIQPIGYIEYSCNPSSNDYMYAYEVSKHTDDKTVMEPQTLFSVINMGLLDDPDYKNAIANTLLSDNNIELSHSYGFVGELGIIENSDLADGEEKFNNGFYTYKIPGSKYTLIYEDAKIEAAKAYRDEQEKKINAKESDNDER